MAIYTNYKTAMMAACDKIKGKVVTKMYHDDSDMNGKIIFEFEGGGKIIIEYDYIYEIEVISEDD